MWLAGIINLRTTFHLLPIATVGFSPGSLSKVLSADASDMLEGVLLSLPSDWAGGTQGSGVHIWLQK